jgi:hypothetical protein
MRKFFSAGKPKQSEVCSFARKKRKEGSFMKKVLLVVALLLLATPVFAADVDVTSALVGDINKTSDPNWTQKVRIGYTATAADTIRAFALVLTVDSGANLDNIADFNRGECKTAGKGYGIFPGKFRDVINPADPCWIDTAYNPIAPAGDLNGAGGNDNPRMVVELGTIYQDPNYPGASGTLFTVDVNSEGAAECNLCIAIEMTRGGIVKKDSNAATYTLPACLKVPFPRGVIVPEIRGQLRTVANGMITGVGLDVGPNLIGLYTDVCAVDIVMAQQPAAGTLVELASDVNYTYSLGKIPTPAQLLYPAHDPDANLPVYWSQVAQATSYDLERSANYGGAWTNVYTGTATFRLESLAPGFYRYRVRAKNAASTGDWLTKTVDCNAYISSCYRGGNTSDPNWNQWKSAGRPDCWCAWKAATSGEPNGSGYQCDGDADATTNVSGYRVYSVDLTALSNHYKKTAAQLTADPNVSNAGRFRLAPGCADFDHKANASGYRVYSIDLTILSNNYKKLNSSTVTATNRLPGNCPR